MEARFKKNGCLIITVVKVGTGQLSSRERPLLIKSVELLGKRERGVIPRDSLPPCRQCSSFAVQKKTKFDELG